MTELSNRLSLTKSCWWDELGWRSVAQGGSALGNIW